MSANDTVPPGWFREQVAEIEGRKCLNGIGPVPCRVLFVQYHPEAYEIVRKAPYSSKQAQFLVSRMKELGLPLAECRKTYSTKHCPRRLNAEEVKWGAQMFLDELGACSPELVVCFGADALKAVVGPTYSFEDVHGAFFVPDSIPDCPFKVFATYNLEQVLYGPKWDRLFDRDLLEIGKFMRGESVDPPECDHAVLHEPSELRSFADWVLGRPGGTLIALDCEWHGRNWMDPGRYFRTVQLGYDRGKVVILEISREGGEPATSDRDGLFRELKRLLESPKVGIVGHNVIADGEWLLADGIDIRDRVVYDTMLAEHIIDQNGPFGLETLSMKYTPYGRYSVDVEVWARRNKLKKNGCLSKDGYGFVPRDMLLGYAGADVDVLRYIMDAQVPVLRERGCLRARGVDGEYPSLFRSVLNTQRVTYDLERNGMPVDMAQLDMLTDVYQEAKARTLAAVMKLARENGFPDFNPRSSIHLRKMLFGNLGLTPVKTTDGDDWGDAVGDMGMDDDSDPSASTDKQTLEILSGRHPFVDALLDFRRVDQVCKTWLTRERGGEPAGLYASIWPDGTFKSRFSTLTETGRYRTSAPNCQNFSKKAESYLSKVFGKGNEPPSIRTIVDPMSRAENMADGRKWVQLEGDFCQAEMFVAANLSGDENMLRALTTPGLDLHDKTAVDSFGLRMLSEAGDEVTEDDLVALAARVGVESDEFQHFMKALTYVGKHGERMSRAEFKSSLRVASKAINFGIMYGRGSRAISLQIKADTGDPRSVDEIDAVTSVGLRSWKESAYPTLWGTLQGWSQLLYSQGYVENPWGRRKYGAVRDGRKDASLERQFSNFPIQSTVADTVQIAMDKMRRFIDDTGLPFRLQNQIHDALMVECPLDMVDECKRMFRDTMAGIRIPLPGGRWFSLDIDIDVYERWGVKMK